MQRANRVVATTASYYQGEFAAHVHAWTEGRGEGNMETVMPIDDFKDLFVLKVAEMA